MKRVTTAMQAWRQALTEVHSRAASELMAAAALAFDAGDARISARPVPPHLLPPQPPATPGAAAAKSRLVPLDVEPLSSRDGKIFIPSTYNHKLRTPLLIFLHGASASGEDCTSVFKWSDLEANRTLMLLPDSRGNTWDMMRGSFGADVRFLDRALKLVFENYNIDPWRVCIGGFSDGASYALSIGLPNGGKGDWGDQIHGPFTHVMALSPGFMRPTGLSPIKPKVFISHGVSDQVLDINHCSRRIAARLSSWGFHTSSPSSPDLMEYHEFTGGHNIPAKIASEALDWCTKEAQKQVSK